MPVNFSNVNFQSFVDFAQQRFEAGDKKAVISATVTKPLQGRSILSVDQTKADSVHKWTRGFDEWTVNDRTRSLFKQAVADLFGGEAKIPESVKKAMLLGDYNQGKPLTARRILAVKAAVTPFIENFNSKLAAAKAGAGEAYGKVNVDDEDRAPDAEIVTKEQVDGLVETAMKAVGEDRDALDVFAGRGVMDGLLVRGDATLRSPADVEKKAKALLANIAELKRAANGNPSILAAGKLFLTMMGGKSAPAGVITAIVRAALSADVSALKRLSASSSGRSLHKALNQFVTAQVRIIDISGADKAMDGADERASAHDFVGLLLLARCGASGIGRIQAAMRSENARKLNTIYGMIQGRQFDKDGLSSAVVKQTSAMGARWQGQLSQLKIAAEAMMGVPDERIDMIGTFEEDFDYEDFGSPRIVGDLIEAGKAEARRTHDQFLQKVVKGDAPGADALRKVYDHLLGPEAYDPKVGIDYISRGNISAMINWTIASECRKIAKGDWQNTTFAKDLQRMSGSLKLGDVVLSDDFATARNQIASFVTKGAKADYGSLSAAEKGKAHVVMALLSQEIGKAAFDGQWQSLDPKNARPPVATISDQDADTRDITLDIDHNGDLKINFSGTQHLQILMTDPGTGKPVTTMVGAGSTVEALLDFTIKAHEFDRLANLEYTGFDDTRAQEIMADKTAEDKLPNAQKSFSDGFMFVENATYMKLGLKATILS